MGSPPRQDVGVRSWQQSRGHSEGPFCFSSSISCRISASSLGWIGGWDRDQRRRPDKLRGVTRHQKLRVASLGSPKRGHPPNSPHHRSPMGTKEKGLPEDARPHPTGWGRLGGHSHGPWLLGGPRDAAAVVGVCSLVPPRTWDAGRCPCPQWLWGYTVTAQGPLGTYKPQKIKFFFSKIHGQSGLGSCCAGEGFGDGCNAAFWRRWVVKFLPRKGN